MQYNSFMKLKQSHTHKFNHTGSFKSDCNTLVQKHLLALLHPKLPCLLFIARGPPSAYACLIACDPPTVLAQARVVPALVRAQPALPARSRARPALIMRRPPPLCACPARRASRSPSCAPASPVVLVARPPAATPPCAQDPPAAA